ncbi:flagellar basal body P-ring formation chaperone FlgA [Lysobacter panacisoli]|uniref:Flagella basal body P-ring formation protein FlgA n=1 Tax=Lysobacter panacisoli TaxID=1255263 RepID=A0ABP9LH90_9GAMM|nr:flagellar basal body P-ring formation chaperone FlgA [Lysobacter panacisoli]
MRAILIALLALTPSLLQAGAFQSPDSIRTAAIAAMGAAGQVDASVDSQLRMPACGQPLAATVAGATSVAVRCADNPGWQVYVPVRVRREADVVVLARPVRSDEPIGPEHLAVQRRELGQEAGPVVADPAAALGRRLRKAKPAGAVLTADDLGDEAALRRGDPVTLVSRAGGMEVRMGGRALGPARMGSTVSVENTGSRRIIRGRLVGPGVVEVNL